MDASSTQAIIVTAIGNFGGAALVVLGAILGVAVGLLVFRWGWRKIRGVAH